MILAISNKVRKSTKKQSKMMLTDKAYDISPVFYQDYSPNDAMTKSVNLKLKN